MGKLTGTEKTMKNTHHIEILSTMFMIVGFVFLASFFMYTYVDLSDEFTLSTAAAIGYLSLGVSCISLSFVTYTHGKITKLESKIKLIDEDRGQ